MLARLSFTFLILAGLLLYQAYREVSAPVRPPAWRVGLYCAAAGISVGLAVRGIRDRHRRE